MFGSWRQPDMQALQISLFLQQLNKFVASLQKDSPVPWVISGDFNMYPYFPLYDIISTGNVTDEGLERLNPNKYKYPQVVPKPKVRMPWEDEQMARFLLRDGSSMIW
jgi:endonuclease/exonuclease/phosphatase family metal-dependent hydrolase